MNEQMTIYEAESLLSQIGIPIIDKDVNYWFIRTSGGENFENFYFGHYVAIGWDLFNDLSMLKEMAHEVLKKKIANAYPYDAKPGSTASQIKRFVETMKIGDYVLIPGANCDRIAFGKIVSDVYVYQPTEQDKIDLIFGESELQFLKRRDVEWITSAPFNRSEIDPMLIPIIYSYGTIVDANPYSAFINRTIYDLYYQNGELHAIYDITETKNISAFDFNNFINNIFSAMQEYSEITGFETDKHLLSIKASINSPGPVEIITAATSAFIFLSGLTLFLNGAHVKLTYNILHIASGEIKIDSPGLIEKIKKLTQVSNETSSKILESEKNLIESRQALKISKKKKKK